MFFTVWPSVMSLLRQKLIFTGFQAGVSLVCGRGGIFAQRRSKKEELQKQNDPCTPGLLWTLHEYGHLEGVPEERLWFLMLASRNRPRSDYTSRNGWPTMHHAVRQILKAQTVRLENVGGSTLSTEPAPLVAAELTANIFELKGTLGSNVRSAEV